MQRSNAFRGLILAIALAAGPTLLIAQTPAAAAAIAAFDPDDTWKREVENPP